jgi:hypothetical protein
MNRIASRHILNGTCKEVVALGIEAGWSTAEGRFDSREPITDQKFRATICSRSCARHFATNLSVTRAGGGYGTRWYAVRGWSLINSLISILVSAASIPDCLAPP